MSLPPLQPLSANVSAAPQLEPAAMALLAQAGFKSIINNRPDHEGGADQPTSAAMEAAALAAGLAYRHLPVAPGYQSAEEIMRLRELLEAMLEAEVLVRASKISLLNEATPLDQGSAHDIFPELNETMEHVQREVRDRLLDMMSAAGEEEAPATA